MQKLKKIPDAELEIMMVIWEASESVNSDFIMQHLHKNWAKPTLLNLLSRLCDRGFLSCEKNGRINMYSSLIAKEEYVQAESENFLKKMHYNSVTGFIASLYGGKSISKNDLKELKKFIEEAE